MLCTGCHEQLFICGGPVPICVRVKKRIKVLRVPPRSDGENVQENRLETKLENFSQPSPRIDLPFWFNSTARTSLTLTFLVRVKTSRSRLFVNLPQEVPVTTVESNPG